MSLPKFFSTLVKRKPQPQVPSAPPRTPATPLIKTNGPEDIAARLLDAVALHKQGHLVQAEAAYRELLRAQPGHFDALHYLGLIALQRGKYEEGIALIEQALRSDSQNVAALGNLAMALRQLRRHDEAVAHYRRALAVKSDSVELHCHLINTLLEQQKSGDALASCTQALDIKPDSALLHQLRGTIQLTLRRYEEAIADFDHTLALDPDMLDALANRGVALAALDRCAEAVAAADQLLQRKPDDIEARFNRANALRKLKRPVEALADYERVLKAQPEHQGALNNFAITCSDLGRFELAVAPYRKLNALAPDNVYVPAALYFCQLYGCDWSQIGGIRQRVLDLARSGKLVADPFRFLNVSDSAEAQKQCASAFVASKHPASPEPLWKGERYQHGRIRVAYLSADFHEHATAYLMAGLFEAHDKRRFETIAISFGPDTNDEMRRRLQPAFDRFIDVREKTDLEVAQLLREMEVDIAVDLKGFTENGRIGILAHRPAPVQVSHIGYPGTSGADYIDYLIADRHLVPEGAEQHFSEKIVYMPDSYQVNDSKRPIATSSPTRAQLGLPESGIVFCSFNNNYKITPEVFDVWMRLLKQVPGSVLWLLEANAAASANLKREAQARGIPSDRLVFAPRMPQKDHLARQRVADLFLDTVPVNAHTTASDALWAGLPVLTCSGNAFAGRVAGSLLHAVGMPELVTHSLGEYEAMALALATSPAMLADLKSRLERQRETLPLFDTLRFCRHLESAYVKMWQRYQDGEAPSHLQVDAM